MFKSGLICTAVALAFIAHAEDDGDFVVVARKKDEGDAPKSETKLNGKKLADLLAPETKDAEYHADILAIVKALREGKLNEDDQKEIAAGIKANADRAGKAFAGLLDWKRVPDANVRLGALEGVRVAYTAYGSAVGGPLATSAMGDPSPAVKAAAVKLIKDRNDRVAVKYIFQTMLKSMEHGESTQVPNTGTGGAAIATLKALGCKQCFSALLYYERIARNVGITGATNLETVKIKAPNVDLPTTVANNEIGMFQYTNTFPGLAILKAISGEDYQGDFKKWQEWIDAQPDYKP